MNTILYASKLELSSPIVFGIILLLLLFLCLYNIVASFVMNFFLKCNHLLHSLVKGELLSDAIFWFGLGDVYGEPCFMPINQKKRVCT